MMHRAKKKGANAVVGVDVDYEVLGEKNGMLMVSVSGTAVVVEQNGLTTVTVAGENGYEDDSACGQ